MHDRADRFDFTRLPPRIGRVVNERARGALGDLVRGRRRALGLSQDELADLAGTSRRFVHMVEAGKPSVQLDKLLVVLGVLGLGLQVVPGDGEIAGEVEIAREAPQDGP